MENSPLVLVHLDAAEQAAVEAAARAIFGPEVRWAAVPDLDAALALPAGTAGGLLVLGLGRGDAVERALAAEDDSGLPRWGVLVLARDVAGAATPGGGEATLEVLSPRRWAEPAELAAALRTMGARLRLARGQARAHGDVWTIARRVSHELRSPLGCILTTTEMLREVLGGEGSGSVRLTQPVIDSAVEAVKLVDRVNFVVRASVQAVVKTPVDAGAAFFSALEQLGPRILRAQARIQEPEHWLHVPAVAKWLEVIWLNLLENALTHGGPQPRIEAGWRADGPGGAVRFWLRDHGPGLPEGRRSDPFPAFHRLHEAHAPHGFGLPIVRRLVELLGGGCGYQAAEGGGACFHFTLPGAAGTAAPGPLVSRVAADTTRPETPDEGRAPGWRPAFVGPGALA